MAPPRGGEPTPSPGGCGCREGRGCGCQGPAKAGGAASAAGRKEVSFWVFHGFFQSLVGTFGDPWADLPVRFVVATCLGCLESVLRDGGVLTFQKWTWGHHVSH